MLSDAAREDQRVESAQHRGIRPHVPGHRVDELLHRGDRVGQLAVLQHAHVAADAGQPEQAAALVQRLLQRRDVELPAPEQVQQRIGRDVPAARGHRQPRQAREAHGRVDAAAIEHRAQAGAAAQVRGDHPARLRFERAHAVGDVLVGQAVIAAMMDARAAHGLGQRVGARRLRHRQVERRIEAGDLRQPGHQGRDRPRAAHVEGLVRGLHGRLRGQRLQHLDVEAHGPRVARAAEHHAMSGGDDPGAGQVALQPGDDETKCLVVIGWLARGPRVRRKLLSGCVMDSEAGRTGNRLDAAGGVQRQHARLVDVVGRELQAGRARVEDQEGVGHARPSATAASRGCHCQWRISGMSCPCWQM